MIWRCTTLICESSESWCFFHDANITSCHDQKLSWHLVISKQHFQNIIKKSMHERKYVHKPAADYIIVTTCSSGTAGFFIIFSLVSLQFSLSNSRWEREREREWERETSSCPPVPCRDGQKGERENLIHTWFHLETLQCIYSSIYSFNYLNTHS